MIIRVIILSEGLMKSLIHSSRCAMKNPYDYETRNNIATLAFNTILCCIVYINL